MNSKKIATCDCRKANDFIQTEIIYSVVHEDFVCLYCDHYPFWTNEKPSTDGDSECNTESISKFVERWEPLTLDEAFRRLQ